MRNSKDLYEQIEQFVEDKTRVGVYAVVNYKIKNHLGGCYMVNSI